MRLSIISLLATVTLTLSARNVLEIEDLTHPDAIANEVIVTFHNGANAEEHYRDIAHPEGSITDKYNFGTFVGYALRAEPESELMKKILKHKAVKLVEQNKTYGIDDAHTLTRAVENTGAFVNLRTEPVKRSAPVKKLSLSDDKASVAQKLRELAQQLETVADDADTSVCLMENEATWGLVRTVNVNNDKTGVYGYKPESGEGIRVYVIDTGVYVQHADFEGRVVDGYNYFSAGMSDGHGHGTHVAGTIASKTWGLAKKATIVPVKVLSDSGSGSLTSVLSGVNWSVNNCQDKSKCVANMSLGGGRSSSFNNAINAAVTAGLLVVTAAGNSAADSCNSSPGSASKAFNVMCSDTDDKFCSFSNWGHCAQIIAPGRSITSTWKGSTYADNTISGTSMAAPHIAGIATKMMSGKDFQWNGPEEVKDAIINMATPNKVTAINTAGATSTVNKLAFYICD